MDPDELRAVLEQKPFEGFTVVMTNGDKFVIRHPEFVVMTADTLHLFQSFDPDADVPVGAPTRLAVVNMSSIHPYSASANSN